MLEEIDITIKAVCKRLNEELSNKVASSEINEMIMALDNLLQARANATGIIQ
jgi:transcriptional regulator NrdR family protein